MPCEEPLRCIKLVNLLFVLESYGLNYFIFYTCAYIFTIR